MAMKREIEKHPAIAMKATMLMMARIGLSHRVSGGKNRS
jgi:uncharacterized protein YneF (UPF0154 family)